ncbi:GNAT family N-acetyltransferase [Nannocystaceae bacterium ST9]
MDRSEILHRYQELERLDAEIFASRFDPRGRFRLANDPPAIGPAAIARTLHDFFGLLDAMHHDVSGLWEIPEGWVIEALVDYRVRGGEQVFVATASILRVGEQHFEDFRVYADLAPVFAAAQAAVVPNEPKFGPTTAEVKHEATAHKGAFVIDQDGERRAELTYTRAGDLLILDHTWVDDRARGQGLGSRLVETAVAFVRAEGTRIMPLCPYARSVFARRADLRDVLA